MIRRLLLLAAALIAAWWWWMRRSKGKQRAARDATPGPRQVAGPMVRDRVCNTFLPQSRAVVLVRDGKEHFFCSEDCRDKYVAGTG